MQIKVLIFGVDNNWEQESIILPHEFIAPKNYRVLYVASTQKNCDVTALEQHTNVIAGKLFPILAKPINNSNGQILLQVITDIEKNIKENSNYKTISKIDIDYICSDANPDADNSHVKAVSRFGKGLELPLPDKVSVVKIYHHDRNTNKVEFASQLTNPIFCTAFKV